MALRAVPDHPKFADLRVKLNIPKYAVLGCLEALWHFCARYTPQGNIGKYNDSAIEAWLEWSGVPGSLVSALLDTGWIEADSEFRLVVHDWSQFADEIVNTELARRCKLFCDGSIPRSGRLNQTERERFRQWLSADNQPVISHESAKKPKPEPVPEPEPEPEPEPKAFLRSPKNGSHSKAPLSPEQVIEELQQQPAFIRLDVRREFEKCSAWCDANHKQAPSKKRLVNWCMRALDSVPLVEKDKPSMYYRTEDYPQ